MTGKPAAARSASRRTAFSGVASAPSTPEKKSSASAYVLVTSAGSSAPPSPPAAPPRDVAASLARRTCSSASAKTSGSGPGPVRRPPRRLVPGRHRRGVFPGLRLERLTRRRRRPLRRLRRRRRRRVRRLPASCATVRRAVTASRYAVSSVSANARNKPAIKSGVTKNSPLSGSSASACASAAAAAGGVRVAQRVPSGAADGCEARRTTGARTPGGAHPRRWARTTIDTLGGGFAEPDERRRHRRGVDAGRAGFEHERDRAPIQLERGRGRGRLRLRLRTMNDNAWWVRG